MQKDALAVAIATLEKLRETYHSQLDASVLAELDDVLELLKQQFERLEAVRRGELEDRVFRIFAMVLRIVTNITDLMDHWL
jgi:putative sterol carrier protein